MNFLSLIEAKREGRELPESLITEGVRAYVRGEVPDYQVSAFLMAVFFRGMSTEETRALMTAMRDSGDKLEFPSEARPVVDKHSTGGVGDKVSLPLAPLLACLGFRVPMISGRGLGITGGTLDKLDSIPGYRSLLSKDEIIQTVQQIGCVIVGQTDNMVPADKKLYALRDGSGTVPSIPLITASILSKKLAEGLDYLILDVKWGSAAFMQTRGEAETLAKAMVDLGTASGTATEAFLNDMNTPLGCAAGNWIEVVESVECLQGKGPADLRDLVLQCAARLLVMSGKSPDLSAALEMAGTCLDSGAPLQKWQAMLAAQGADLEAYERKLASPSDAFNLEVASPASGLISACQARSIAEVVRDLGGGRQKKEDSINFAVGIDQLRKPGESISAGEPLCRILAADKAAAEAQLPKVLSAFTIQ